MSHDNHRPNTAYMTLRQCNCSRCMDRELEEREAARKKYEDLRDLVDKIREIAGAHDGLKAINELLRPPTAREKWDADHRVTDTHVYCRLKCGTERGIESDPTCALCGPRPREDS